MSELISWFLIAAFFYYILSGLTGKIVRCFSALWPWSPAGTKRVFYKLFIGFLIFLTFVTSLSAILRIFNIVSLDP